MKARDFGLVLCGAVLAWAVSSLLHVGSREAGTAPPPAPPPSMARPAAERRAEPAPPARIDRGMTPEEITALVAVLDSGPPDRGDSRRGFPGNPFMGRDMASLEAQRNDAGRVLDPLLAKWRAASPGEERAAAMKEMAMPMFRFLEAGGPAENLLILEEAAERGATSTERKWAMIATHTLWQSPVVDFLLARTRSPHPEVRFYAVEGLAWVRGDETARAIDGVVQGLEDDDPEVRGIAAASLSVIVGDPARADALLARLARETDPGAAAGMAKAVVNLDPANGRERVRAAMGSVPEDVRASAEKVLAGAK